MSSDGGRNGWWGVRDFPIWSISCLFLENRNFACRMWFYSNWLVNKLTHQPLTPQSRFLGWFFHNLNYKLTAKSKVLETYSIAHSLHNWMMKLSWRQKILLHSCVWFLLKSYQRLSFQHYIDFLFASEFEILIFFWLKEQLLLRH